MPHTGYFAVVMGLNLEGGCGWESGWGAVRYTIFTRTIQVLLIFVVNPSNLMKLVLIISSDQK